MFKKYLFVLASLMAMLASIVMVNAALAAKEGKTQIYIVAARPGDPWNILSHALAGFINQRSTWLKADVLATAGVSDDTRLLVGDPQKRKNSIIVGMLPGWRTLGKGVYVPYKIGTILEMPSVWVTLSNKIKNLSDLKDKVVAMPRHISGTYGFIFTDLFKQLEILNTIRPRYGGLGATLLALQDGAATAGTMVFNYVYPDHYSLGSKMMELQARGPLHYLQQGNVKANSAAIAKACHSDFFKDQDLPNLSMVIPPHALGKTQEKAMAVVTVPIFWAASKDVPDKIIYEVTRILYEAAKNHDFDSFHATGKGITPNFLVTSFWDTEKEARNNYHPGALKFYDQVGLKMKSFKELGEKYSGQ